MTPRPAARLTLNGALLLADLEGALAWPAERLVAVADLHLEKGSAYARGRRFLPPYDSGATLARLAAVLARHRPERVICLGDSFHDAGAGDRLAEADAALLRRLVAAHDWGWVCGNHDPAPPLRWGGRIVAEFALAGLRFRHEAQPGPVAGEVSGHFHPKVSVSVRGHRIAGRCFVADGRRLILPAFGAYAGGLDAADPAIAGLFEAGYDLHLLGPRRIHTLGLRRGARQPRSGGQAAR